CFAIFRSNASIGIALVTVKPELPGFHGTLFIPSLGSGTCATSGGFLARGSGTYALGIGTGFSGWPSPWESWNSIHWVSAAPSRYRAGIPLARNSLISAPGILAGGWISSNLVALPAISGGTCPIWFWNLARRNSWNSRVDRTGTRNSAGRVALNSRHS